MWKVTIKGLLAHKLRLALTALAIVLGVTFIAGTFVLTDTLHNTFDTLFGNIYQNIDFQVRGVAQFGSGGNATRNPVPESLLRPCAAVPGVEAAEGTVAGYAQFVGPTARPISNGRRPTLGVSFDPTRSSRPAAGRREAADDAARGRDGPGDRPEVRLLGRRAGADLVAGPTQTFTITASQSSGRQQPGRRDAGGVRRPDGAGADGRGRPVRRHQHRRPTGRRQGRRPTAIAAASRGASRW